MGVYSRIFHAFSNAKRLWVVLQLRFKARLLLFDVDAFKVLGQLCQVVSPEFQFLFYGKLRQLVGVNMLDRPVQCAPIYPESDFVNQLI